MGSKNNPGEFDCYSNALPDEPMFILLARDPYAPWLLEEWAGEREIQIENGRRPQTDMAMVKEARQCAENMRAWRTANDGKWRTASPPPPPGDMVLVPRGLPERYGDFRATLPNRADMPHWDDLTPTLRRAFLTLAASPLPTQEVSDAMVERVARAICEASFRKEKATVVTNATAKLSQFGSAETAEQEVERAIASLVSQDWAGFVPEARAAIESALRTGERKE